MTTQGAYQYLEDQDRSWPITHDTTTHNETSKHSTKRPAAFYISFVSLCVISFLTALDAVIVASSLSEIAKSLDATSEAAFWCGTGFLITQAVTPPVYAALSEGFGRKVCILTALMIFLLASVLCGAARSIAWLIAARAMQGLGAGGLNVTSNIIVTDMVGLRDRGKFTGMFALTSALGLLSGSLVGSSIAEFASWRWIFYINIPICLIPLAGLFFFLRLQQVKAPVIATLKRIDWIGILLLTLSSLSFLLGVTTGGILQPWGDARTIVPLVLGILGFVGFVFYEKLYAKIPLIQLRIFTRRTPAAGYVTTFAHGFIVWSISYLLNIYFTGAIGHTMFRAAVDTLPGAILAPAAAITGFLLSWTKRFQKIIWVSWIFIVCGLSGLTTFRPSSPAGAQYGIQVIVALGAGAIFPARMLAIQSDQLDEDVPMATSFVIFIMGLGQAFGVGISGAVFQNRWDALVKEILQSGMLKGYIIMGDEAQSAVLMLGKLPKDVEEIYRNTAAKALEASWMLLAIIAGVAFLTSLFMKNLTLDKDSKTTQKFLTDTRNESSSSETDLLVSRA
ncbi:major facilitator superfamily domain-containing protein [Xylogone sp. PMI_703]|nr:major facilitator superfamily domain-containing protein [Xylogone sp. PMI_703]